MREIERFVRALATGWIGPFWLDMFAGASHDFYLFLFGAVTGVILSLTLWSAGPAKDLPRGRPLPRKA